MVKPSWQRYGRLSGVDAAREAQPIYVCSRPHCEVHHKAIRHVETVIVDARTGKTREKLTWRAPAKCMGCGGLAFEFFASTVEANRWAALRLMERAGLISKLRRQVRYPLMTVAPNGLQIKVAEYIADHVFIRDGKEIIEDVKPRSGMDPVAALKLRWMAAQRGSEVAIYTE